MAAILIVGGGLAGCTSALELADRNRNVIVVEKSKQVGGKVRLFGCKATSRCLNCGLCLVGDLWERVEDHENIEVLTQTQVIDVEGAKGDFVVMTRGPSGLVSLSGISEIVVAIGFEEFGSVATGNFEFVNNERVITGYRLEQMLKERTESGVFAEPPQSAAFIQCYGSRDVQERATYCSRVCCNYATRAARVLKHFHPDMRIVFFYMDVQQVEQGDFFQTLKDEGIEFVKCRPVNIVSGSPNRVLFEKPGGPGIETEEFDVVVLSGGISPGNDVNQIGELCGLGFTQDGFLRTVKDGVTTGIHLTGCASGPKKIEEVYTEALATARGMCGQLFAL